MYTQEGLFLGTRKLLLGPKQKFEVGISLLLVNVASNLPIAINTQSRVPATFWLAHCAVPSLRSHDVYALARFRITKCCQHVRSLKFLTKSMSCEPWCESQKEAGTINMIRESMNGHAIRNHSICLPLLLQYCQIELSNHARF